MLKKCEVIQHDIKDCGAACLLSIMKYYEGNISLEKIRIDTCITKDGISAYNLMTAAEKYGFETKALRYSYEKFINNKVLLPCICYVELKNGLRHYITVYKICNKYIYVMDPAKGFKKMKHEEFKSIFKQVVIILSPKTKIVNYGTNNKLYELFINIISHEKKLVFNIFITSVILTIVSICSSFYIKSIFNIIDLKIESFFIFLIIIFSVVNLLKVITSYLRTYYENYLNKNIDINLFTSFISHILSLPLNAISSRTTGEILTRISEINNIKEVISNMFITLTLNLLMALTSLIILFIINKYLTIILLIIIIIYLINNLIWVKPINNYIDENIDLETSFNSNTSNVLNKFISLKNDGNYPIFKTIQSLIQYISNTFNIKSKLNKYTFINNFIMEIGMFIINTYAFILMFNNNLELIDLITYNSLYIYFIDPIKEIINLLPKYIYIKRSFIKINDFLSLENEKIERNTQKFINGDIVFDNIKFSYNMYDYPINNYTLNIPAGSKTLIMGKSGSGKSTLFKLLFRLYEPLNGNIKINNINIKDYNLSTIRNNITYVSQDDAIYNDTILNNILLGKKVSAHILFKVLRISQVNELLDKKYLRLDTVINSDASNLSGGEKARIILARTLIKNSDIIIFDETFSSIAYKDANKIISDICSNYKNKTLIFISHFKPNFKFDKIVQGEFHG